ncbi:hypothetical protein OIU78_014088 [Salix suchowensis]|nr:hypothetical protein OIU78_014088 [Salix suchowensis]
MTVIVRNAADVELFGLQQEEKKKTHGDASELVSDGGFKMPENNAFGQSFRDYNNADSERQEIVERTYRLQHINQTYDFVKKMREEYGKLDKAEMSIWECCELLNDVVDESDPRLG